MIGGPDPPGKSQVIWVSIEISIWTPQKNNNTLSELFSDSQAWYLLAKNPGSVHEHKPNGLIIFYIINTYTNIVKNILT